MSARAEYSPTNKQAPAHKIDEAHLINIPLTQIRRSSLNPRTHFDGDALAELANSIKQHGLLEPIVLRPVDRDADGRRYEIIAGERRCRASQMAGLTTIPARVIPVVDDREALELALVENLMRQDLDPLEEAAGYKALADIGYKQTEIAAAVKRSQPAIAKSMGLLRLPAEVQEMVRDGRLSATHGAVLTRWADFPLVCTEIARRAVEHSMTAHRLEQDDLPFTYQLQQAKSIVHLLGHDTHFDTDICKSRCPHSAYRTANYGSGYCLRPDHYAELQKEADRAERERIARAQAEAQKAVVSEDAPAGGKKRAQAVGLPTLASLKNVKSLAYQKTPRGCTPQCPCRAQALDRGAEVVAICTDPKRFERLQADDTRAAAKAKRQETRDRRAKAEAMISAIAEVGPREIVALAAAALAHVPNNVANRSVGETTRPKLSSLIGHASTTACNVFADVDPVDVVRAVLTVMFAGELSQEWGRPEVFAWYVEGVGQTNRGETGIEEGQP